METLIASEYMVVTCVKSVGNISKRVVRLDFAMHGQHLCGHICAIGII
jgi:hypothetical protein